MKEFADNDFKWNENGRKSSIRVENTAGKEKLLITSNSSFSNSVYKKLVLQRRKTSACWTLYHTIPTFNDLEMEAFLKTVRNQRTDSPESRLEGNGLEVFTLFCSNLLKAFKIQNNLTIRQYYMQAYFWVVILKFEISVLKFTFKNVVEIKI